MRPLALTVATVVLATPFVAHAATSLHLNVGTEQAEAGEGIRVELNAMSDGDSPSTPRLRVPPGFSLQGPSVSSSQSFSLSNGHFEHRRGITATWIVIAPRPGRYVIGPATAQVGSGTMQSETATVEIVAPGSIPRRAKRRNPFDPSDPFDPFSMMPKIPGMPNLDDLENLQLPSAPPDAPAEFSVEHAAEPMAFLRATVAPTDVIVGQQVTLRVYAYAARGPYDEVGSAEASHADFLAQTLIDSSYRQPRYLMEIDGVRWMGVKIREIALFPLRAGDLTIGAMHMGFRGPGYPETNAMQGLIRSTEELHVIAREPPVAGRPPGYELGNVGQYALSAEVEPRNVTAGDAVAATIRLEGTGNVPHQVKVPEQRGIEWLEPTVNDAVAARDSVVQGNRTFRYVVRLDEPGTHDLGEVTLPFYDPHARKYVVARAALGQVVVAPGKATAPTASAAPAAPAPDDPLGELGPPRKTLGAPAVTTAHLTDRRGYLAMLAGGPLAVVALGGLSELFVRVRKRWSERGQSLGAASRRALAEARAAATGSDGAAVAAAVERAVYTAVEDRLGLKARAVLRPSLAHKLEQGGLPRDLSEEIVALLSACDALRFTSGTEEPKKLVDRTAAVVSSLLRGGRASSERAA